jgi:hypothetical protein
MVRVRSPLATEYGALDQRDYSATLIGGQKARALEVNDSFSANGARAVATPTDQCVVGIEDQVEAV